MRYSRFVAGLSLLAIAIASLGVVGPRILETRTYTSPPAPVSGGIEGSSVETAFSLPATGMAIGAIVLAIVGLVLMVEAVTQRRENPN